MTTTTTERSYVVSSRQFADDFLALIRDKMDNPEAYRGFHTHLPSLNKALGGLGKNWYVVIGGAQKSGKSALAISMLVALSQPGLKILPVSLEMDNLQVAGRVFSQMTGIPLQKFHTIDELTEKDYNDLLLAANQRVATYGNIYCYGVNYIEDIVELIERTGPDILILDYVQLLSSRKRFPSRNEELEYISGILKREISLNHNCLVIALVQLNKVTAKSKNQMESYGWHGSSAFGKDADVAITITDKYDQDERKVKDARVINIVASRHSDTSSFDVLFIGGKSFMGEALRSIDVVDEVIDDVFQDTFLGEII